MLKKKEIIVLNKIDLIDKKEIDQKKEEFKKVKKKVITISTINKSNLLKIKSQLLKNVH